ncbi:uncharacterized protein LOC129981482 [Argiope bruennichi]|uniref:Uncharacterized protein n=1 Tax=Argiope bruennichi TaxID=94029 RepID=A0A8T0FWV4_ARGBR|nr:uncharacterized protein LOC129981482 [Argiope bruennichi]XP_055948307.1 uncharacterized protein LOC129981482 [Argiope bruennichi]KAF8795604.1 hypothetical protein HNY73_000090 [Argiope bruennichi]
MTTSTVTPKEFGRRFRKALSVPFLLNQVCSTNIQDFVTSYAASLGCTEKCFFFPLLSCAASCMGTECGVQLTTHWLEPPIIWTLVVTPRSLQRIDVAEHLKLQLLQAQNEAWVLDKDEDSKDHLKKFLFDIFNLNQLQDMLRLSNGHGLAIYNSARALYKNLLQPEEADILLRLHSGLAWFSDSRITRGTLTKTRVNFAIVSTPNAVHQTLTGTPNFQELFHQCFLTTCSEESHVKFGQISEISEEEKLREIFVSLLKLHCHGGPLIYKMSAEAKEKFSQIHDELTDKAKQMARKSAHKVFQPALAYLGRLSCVLHVLDNIIDAINYKIPVTRLTWNTEINAATVWQARELLGHIIEQRHALMEPTTIEATQQKLQQPAAIQIVDGQNVQRTPQMLPSPRGLFSPNNVNRTPPIQNSPRLQSSFSFNSARRNLMNNRARVVPRTYPSQNTHVRPVIASVSSAGLPVSKDPGLPFNPIISNCEAINNNNLNSGLKLPSTLSVSVSDETDSAQPILLSRAPFISVQDMSEEEFLSSHKGSVKKLLKHGVSEISPSRCVQLKLTPDPTASDESQKYTPSFARSFLKRIELLGFGICEGPKNGNLRHFVFKKKKFSALGDEQKKILNDLNISESEYNKCFTSMAAQNQNGKLVCLE